MTHTGFVSLPVPVLGHIPGYEKAQSLHVLVPVKRFTGTTGALVTVHSLHVTVPLVLGSVTLDIGIFQNATEVHYDA